MTDEESTEERTEESSGSGEGGGGDAAERAKDKADAWDEAHDKMRKLEEEDEPPTDLKEWPDDEAKYVTYGGGEGDHGYDEGVETKLGPSSLERHEDGSVTIEGEEVDNPDDYKADEKVQPATETTAERRESDGDGDDGDSEDEDEAEAEDEKG